MEETNYGGNLNVEFYSFVELSEEEVNQIQSGQYPIILAKGGVFTKTYCTAEDLSRYSHWDALDSDIAQLFETYGEGLPIVWEWNPEGGMFETGLQHKEISE